jgi:hypothetical protein
MKTILSILGLFVLVTSCSTGLKDKVYKFEDKSGICLDNGQPFNDKSYYFPLSLLIDSFRTYKWAIREHPNEIEVSDDSMIFDNWEIKLDTFEVEWFSGVLFKMKEPILYNKYLNKEIYRLTLLQSFEPDIVMRLEKENNIISITSKSRYEYRSGIYQPIDTNLYTADSKVDSVLLENDTRNLSINFWNDFEKTLEINNFNLMPTTTAMDFGPDGNIWILEKHTKKGYFFVKRSSYSKDLKRLKNIGDFLINRCNVRTKIRR